MIVADSFRRLRAAWFRRVLQLSGPEREWEDEDREKERRKVNDRMRRKYDRQTEEIILGNIKYPVAPICMNDLEVKDE